MWAGGGDRYPGDTSWALLTHDQLPVYSAHAGHSDGGSTHVSALPLLMSQAGGEISSGNNLRLADLNRDKPEIGEIRREVEGSACNNRKIGGQKRGLWSRTYG